MEKMESNLYCLVGEKNTGNNKHTGHIDTHCKQYNHLFYLVLSHPDIVMVISIFPAFLLQGKKAIYFSMLYFRYDGPSW